MADLKEMDNTTFVVYSPSKGILMADGVWSDDLETHMSTRIRFPLYSRKDGEPVLAKVIEKVFDAKLAVCFGTNGKEATLSDINSAGLHA